MKRSKMLKLIEEVVKPCNSCYKEHREATAERMLAAVEEAGMLPPPYNGDLIQGDVCYVHEEIFEWENEDGN